MRLFVVFASTDGDPFSPTVVPACSENVLDVERFVSSMDPGPGKVAWSSAHTKACRDNRSRTAA